jgi:hypothetical protein
MELVWLSVFLCVVIVAAIFFVDNRNANVPGRW